MNARMGTRLTGLRLAPVLSFCLLTVLSGPGASETAAAAAGRGGGGESGIASLSFALPNEVAWVRNPDPNLRRVGITQWVVAGHDARNTPAKVLYQRMAPPRPPAALLGLIRQSLKPCAGVTMGDFTGGSKYHDQINIETICSRLGDEPFGVQSFYSIFSDRRANFLVIAEVRTPPANRAGVLEAGTPAARRQAETSKVFSDLLFKLMRSIRVCDAKKVCI